MLTLAQNSAQFVHTALEEPTLAKVAKNSTPSLKEMNGTDTRSAAALFLRSLPDTVLLAVPLPSKQGIPWSLAARLGSGLGFPMSQLNLPRIITLVSPV